MSSLYIRGAECEPPYIESYFHRTNHLQPHYYNVIKMFHSEYNTLSEVLLCVSGDRLPEALSL